MPLPQLFIGCQARPWLQTWGRDAFRERLPEAMRDIAAAGFTGFETALDCLPLDDPEQFRAQRTAASDIQLTAAHTGGAWWADDAPERIATLLPDIAQLPALGCDRLIVSVGHGAAELDETGIQTLADNLRVLGESAGEVGVLVSLHNHAHELADDARLLRAILDENPSDTLSLGADLGWVAHAGWDILDFLDVFGDRIDYLHIRDVSEVNGKRGFTEVGQGTLNFPMILARLRALGYTGWFIAESEFTDDWLGNTSPTGTAELQANGLRRVVGG